MLINYFIICIEPITGKGVLSPFDTFTIPIIDTTKKIIYIIIEMNPIPIDSIIRKRLSEAKFNITLITLNIIVAANSRINKFSPCFA